MRIPNDIDDIAPADNAADGGSPAGLASRYVTPPSGVPRYPSPPDDTEEPPAYRPRILLADDNVAMRRFLTELLSAHYDVEAVATGDAALRAARERLPDLIISDVVMPGLDGLSLLRALRADPMTQTVLVVLVSARSGEESRIAGLDVGADDYLEKPFTAREFMARVNANIRLARMRREVVEHDQRRFVAEAANEAKTRFLTTMSHELRTPLNAIAGHVQLLDMGLHGPVTEDQRRALDRIRRNGQRLLTLITDILNFSQLEAGKVQYQMQEVAVHELLVGVGTLIEPQLHTKGVTYRYIPCADTDPIVYTDPDRLTQIVLNLLSNAIKFTEPGGTVTMECTVAHEGEVTASAWNRLIIRVSDTGRGIPADKLALVFEPFVQLDRHLVHESQQGVGLGLSISRDLVQHLQGELAVESIEGVGTTFSLVVPKGDGIMKAQDLQHP